VRFSLINQKLLTESNSLKGEANALFTSKRYQDALAKYDEAVAACPNYLDYELAVLQSNISACHLMLEEWKEAISSATRALDGLDKAERAGAESSEQPEKKEKKAGRESDEDEGVEDEIISAGAKQAAPPAAEAEAADSVETRRKKRIDDVERIRAKALLRRGRARSEAGGWQNLAGAEEDYRRLSAMKNLGSSDRKTVQMQLGALPLRTKAAQERETAEMWGKLKQVCGRR
jgi:tetratricopeptide (TPR) repeat protein